MNILDEIAAYARVRVAQDEAVCPLAALQAQCEAMPVEKFQFRAALATPALSFICEIKKASPSKGVIAQEFPYLQIAADYKAAGADAISCLTEPKWFLGSDRIFGEVRRAVDTPMLRKDFVVDEYQIYQAKALGANAVLLICALLDTATIERHLALAQSLGMDALVEAHNEAEIDSAIAAGARIIGVNNRNLKDFHVDFSNAVRLREKIPAGVLYVAESGVQGPADITALHKIGADAVLMGEVLMRAPDKAALLAEMRRAAQ